MSEFEQFFIVFRTLSSRDVFLWVSYKQKENQALRQCPDTSIKHRIE